MLMIGIVEIAAKFESGQIVATPGAGELFESTGTDSATLLKRHLEGDWGEVCADDKALNDEAIKHEGDEAGRVMSVYGVGPKGAKKVWVITEWDRSVTTFLLPEEY